jgi:hypothetical protein
MRIAPITINRAARLSLVVLFFPVSAIAEVTTPFGTRVKDAATPIDTILGTKSDKQSVSDETQPGPNQEPATSTVATPKKQPTPEAIQQASIQPGPSPSPTPENPIEAALSKNPVEVEEIVSLLVKYPNQVIEKLKAKPIELRGVVERVMILGFENDRVEVTLLGNATPRLVLCDDMNTSRGFVKKPTGVKNKWIKENQTLMLSSQGKRGNPNKINILSEGKPYSNKVMLSKVSPTALRFEVVR